MGPRMFHHQFMFRNFFRIVGAKGEVWGIFFQGPCGQNHWLVDFPDCYIGLPDRYVGSSPDLYNGHPISKGICWGVSKGAERNCSLPKKRNLTKIKGTDIMLSTCICLHTLIKSILNTNPLRYTETTGIELPQKTSRWSDLFLIRVSWRYTYLPPQPTHPHPVARTLGGNIFTLQWLTCLGISQTSKAFFQGLELTTRMTCLFFFARVNFGDPEKRLQICHEITGTGTKPRYISYFHVRATWNKGTVL